jgi:hypothetical protein
MLWATCVDRLKDRINSRSFWEALERTHPIAIDGNLLVIGLEVENFSYASHLQQVSTAHTISAVVREVFNQPYEVRLIEGTTLADWEATRQREAQAAAMKQAAMTRHTTETTRSASWDVLYDRLSELYAEIPYRTLPQGKARYANIALYTIVEAMDTLYIEDGDEVMERSLARIIDRVANVTEIPATVLAFELERLRAWRKSGSE